MARLRGRLRRRSGYSICSPSVRSWVTVMDPVQEIARAQSIELVDEDGDAVALTVDPGLQAHEIEAVEEDVGVALPLELRDLLGGTAGIGGVLESIDFTGRSVGGSSFPRSSRRAWRSPTTASATHGCWTSCPRNATSRACSSPATTRP